MRTIIVVDTNSSFASDIERCLIINDDYSLRLEVKTNIDDAINAIPQIHAEELVIAGSLIQSMLSIVGDEELEFQESRDVKKVPIWRKTTLTLEEAAQYSNIGINKLRELSNDPQCDFVIYVGRKRLIKRKEFENFISQNIEV